jgi:two-component system, NarL family, response regulator NreC
MKAQARLDVTTIVIADDHPVVRQGLQTLLSQELGFRIVGEASNGVKTIEMVKRLKPTVLILDLMMPDISGIEVTRSVKKYSPQTHILILSMYSNEAYVLETLRNGAEGYVLKDSPANILLHAIREVLAGRRYLSPPLSERAMDIYIQAIKPSDLDPYEMLTTRERDVFNMAAAGCSNAEIAKQLSISIRTVESHRANFMRKIGLHNQTELVRYALQRGILLLKG